MSGLFLIASSRDSTAHAVQAALSDDQFGTLIARDGLEALDLALDRAPDVIFLSADLGKVDGVQVARAMRSLDLTEHVPIIFLAENEPDAKKITQEQLPFTECLTAPFHPNEVKTYAANALRNAKRLVELRQREDGAALYSIHDPLTHVYHRRYAVNRLAHESSRCVRYQHPLSVLLVDVDNLKVINREHGIVVGDAVLIETAQVLYKTARRTDLVGRYGTQDFIVILSETNQEGALKLANRIRHVVAGHKFLDGKLDLNVTVSVGVAGAAGSDLAENLALIGRAATALDRAKHAGKNRVEQG